MSFWKSPACIGLAPMDGVTDAAYRAIVDTYGKPDFLMTEFVPVAALRKGAYQALRGLIKHDTETPTIAQFFGTDPREFYEAAHIAGELGFDGIDINMGCPDRSIAKKGAGAGLIRTPSLAQKIIRETHAGMRAWSEGETLEEAGIHPRVIAEIRAYQKSFGKEILRRTIPISVKTRIGYDLPQTKEWIAHILEERPDNLTVHGRTLKQMYTGEANWEEIGLAAQLGRDVGIPVIGSGDVSSREEARSKIATYGVNGVIIGRAAFGNPWIFAGIHPNVVERIDVALEHARMFSEILSDSHYLSMRKHLAWYCRGFHDATKYRERLMQVVNYHDVVAILDPLLNTLRI